MKRYAKKANGPEHVDGPSRDSGPAEMMSELPDARDGLTRTERLVLLELQRLQRERKACTVPTAQLYGRVLQQVDLSVEELQRILARLSGVRTP